MDTNRSVPALLAGILLFLCLSMSAQVAVTTFQYNNSRTGARNTHESNSQSG